MPFGSQVILDRKDIIVPFSSIVRPGVGLGGQKYQMVILFQNQSMFDGFIDNAWKADGTAQAAAGTAGANAATEFTNGIAVYQFTEGGLMASADISGTRYWKSDKLNQ